MPESVPALTCSGDGFHDYGTPNRQLADLVWSASVYGPKPASVNTNAINEYTRVGWFAYGTSMTGSSDPSTWVVGERRYISFEREDWSLLNDPRGLFQFLMWHILPGWEFELRVFYY